jgi:hypothetical protein
MGNSFQFDKVFVPAGIVRRTILNGFLPENLVRRTLSANILHLFEQATLIVKYFTILT